MKENVRKKEIFEKIFQDLAIEADLQDISIDSTIS